MLHFRKHCKDMLRDKIINLEQNDVKIIRVYRAYRVAQIWHSFLVRLNFIKY